MRRLAAVYFCLMFGLIVGCGPSNKIPKNFDYGKIDGLVYKNDFFKFEITAPEGWHVQGPEKMSEMLNEGLDELGNKEADKIKKIAEVTTANLWSCLKYDVNNVPEGETNLCVLVVTEKLPSNAKDLTIEKYLEITRDQIKKIVPAAQFKPVTKEMISGKEFSVQRNTQPVPGVPGLEIQQESRVCFINNHAFIIGTTYLDDDEKPELQEILDTIKFTP